MRMNVTRRTQTEFNVKLAQVVKKKGEKDEVNVPRA